MRIAVIGAGVSGIGAAHILQKNGHHVTVFEKMYEPGGVWAVAYPDVTLQNSKEQYHFSDFPWPFEPNQHPTAAQIKRYLKEAIQFFCLDVRFSHQVLSMKEQGNGWSMSFQYQDIKHEEFFDYVVIAIGQYTEGKKRPHFDGEEQFQGTILTEREISDLEDFRDKEVAVIGFGKSALDMAAFAAPRAKKVRHVFRTPRWLVPLKVLGIHYSYPFFCRLGSVMVHSWKYPTKVERFIHQKMKFLVNGFWQIVSSLFKANIHKHGKGQDDGGKQRLKTVSPKHDIKGDLRSAVALAPANYYQEVANGNILPYHSNLTSFSSEGIKLEDGREIAADMVVLSLGADSPRFPFLPQSYRSILEKEKDGVQLYRHLIHPELPNIGFAGFNHGFMHIPSIEVGTLWLCAYLAGDLVLPSKEEMLEEIEYIQGWKREHINFESSRNCAVNIRFQQYLDSLLKELGLSPYRKMPNILAEAFVRYGASDYKGVSELYQKKKKVSNKHHNAIIAEEGLA